MAKYRLTNEEADPQMIVKSKVLENEFIQVTKTYYEVGVTMEPHQHDFTSISIVLNGLLKEVVGESRVEGGIAQTSIKPAGTIHQNYFSQDCHILSIAIKDVSVLDPNAIDVLQDWHWVSGVNSIGFFLSVIKCSEERDFLNLINSWMNYLSETLNSRQKDLVPDWIQQTKSFLDNNYHQPLRSDLLAEQFNVHRVYLARVFRRFFGVSIKEYLNAVRIHNAIGSIVMNKQSMVQTALENGFADQSHFNRKFKERLDITPSELRQLTS